MNVLYLDDDDNARAAFVDWVKAMPDLDVKITPVSNLVDFHSMIFEEGEEFDKYILDLNIITPPDIPEDVYDDWLREIGITEQTLLMNRIPIIGLDYLNKVMREKEPTKRQIDKVLLKTGYKDLLLQENMRYLPAKLLNKGDKNYLDVVKSFLKKN